MNKKKIRHFLCGLLCGVAGMYWCAFAAEDTLDQVQSWLENVAEEYRATHDTPSVNSGWRQQTRKNDVKP